ncbi:hypothetical protein C0Q70_03759 [Pomacea canaliculata]|uniref:Uncharacterized protein n=1 Tax=Pomacea canaliculata TaxID=400727 RepID=A0A2T7PTN0_POMCA|nr:hypothetical protein C0Q70_03759 [Pomacea canaliculata]
MMWSRGCSPYINKGDAEFSCSPGGTTIPTIIATTTPSTAATTEHVGYVGHVDLTLMTSSRQFLSPDVGPALHPHGHHHHHHHGVTSGTGTGTSGLERVPSANRLQPQSSTETSGLGETVTSGFSSQESVHSAASYNFNPSASSTTIAPANPNEEDVEDDDIIAHTTTTSSLSAASTSRTGRYSNPSPQEARPTDGWRTGIDRPHRLAWNDGNGQGGDNEGRAGGRGGGIVQRRQDARRTGHSSSGVGDYAASRSAVAQSEGREKEEKGRKKRAPEDRHAAGDCVRECDVGGGGGCGGGCGARGGGGSGGNSSGGGCGGKGEVTVAGEQKAGGGNFGERSRRCEIDRTLPRSGRLRDGAGGSEEKRGGRERTGSSCGNSPPDSGAPPFPAADRPRGRERDGAAARGEDRDHKVLARRNRDSSQGKSSAREKDGGTAGRSDGRLRAKEEGQAAQDVQRQRESRGRRDSGKKSGVRLDNERRRERNLEKPKSRDSDASSAPIDGQQARHVASNGNRILEKQPSRDSGRGRSPDVQTPEEAAAHSNARRAKSASGNHRHAPARSPPPASSDVTAREFDHLVTSARGDRAARGPQHSAAEDGGSGLSALTERSYRDVKRGSFDEAGDGSCGERFLSAVSSSRRGGEGGSAAGGGREAADRGHVSRGACRSRDARVPLPPPPAATDVNTTHQVSDGHIKGNPRRDSRSDSVRVVQASAEPVTSSQQLHQLQRGGAAHEDLQRQRNAGRDRKSVDKGKRSEASRQADDRGRSGAVADRGRHASADTGPKPRQEGASLTGSCSKRGSDPPPLTSASDSPGRHTRLRDDRAAKVEGYAPGRSAGARELGSERRNITEEKSQPTRVSNSGAEHCDQKVIRVVEKEFTPDKASVSGVGSRPSRTYHVKFCEGRHKQSDYVHGSKTKQDRASRDDLPERSGGSVSRGAEQLDTRAAPRHDDRPRSESSVQPPRGVVRRSDAGSRNLRGSSERTDNSVQ